jgi:sulfate transport system ATP-binding protein
MRSPSAPSISGATEIRIAGIRKEFGATAALRGVDLDVRHGELLALLGPSGSGKTTLLRVIAGLEIPDAGRVHFGADDVTDRPVQERGVGFVFQHYALFKHLNVFDNIAYGPRARRRGRPSREALRQRVGQLLALVQLDGLERRFPSQLSGGQRQRVALARALAVDPRVLLLDEPFGALDARVRKDLRRWLREIHKETGQTTVFVTHDQDEALEVADRVAILNDGRLEQLGTPDEVFDEPASSFVMSFVGDSVRLPITVRGGKAFVGEHPLALPIADAADGEADLFVRPWDIVIAEAGAASLTGIVQATRRTAGAKRADIRLSGCDVAIEIELPQDRAVAPGEVLGLTVANGRVFPRQDVRGAPSA